MVVSSTGSSASGLSAHQVSVAKSVKVRLSAKGSSVIQIQRKRTEERVYPSGMGVEMSFSHFARSAATVTNRSSSAMRSWSGLGLGLG